jgi:hypothetical protein
VAGELDVRTAAWLVSDDGLGRVADVVRALDAGDGELTILTFLRRERLDPASSAAVLAAAEARRRARERWPDADQLLFTREALEQASDPVVSAWRATRFTDATHVEDRAAGCGGDTLALAAVARAITAIDTDGARLTLLNHNATVRGLQVGTVVADALVHPPPDDGPVHADPGRRVDGRRVRRLAEHRPPVPALLEHLADTAAGPGVAIVLGPGLDLDDPDLPAVGELEFVQLGDRLVEAVLWTGDLCRAGADATATVLSGEPLTSLAGPAPVPLVERSRGARGAVLAVGAPGDVLLDVAPAAVRARLHDELGAEVGARRLALRRALLTVDGDAPPSPWWRRRAIEAVLPARAAAVRRHLRPLAELPVEVVLHGVQVDPVAFHRALGGVPSGPRGRRVELVRTDDAAIALVTRDLDVGGPAGAGQGTGR